MFKSFFPRAKIHFFPRNCIFHAIFIYRHATKTTPKGLKMFGKHFSSLKAKYCPKESLATNVDSNSPAVEKGHGHKQKSKSRDIRPNKKPKKQATVMKEKDNAHCSSSAVRGKILCTYIRCNFYVFLYVQKQTIYNSSYTTTRLVCRTKTYLNTNRQTPDH